MSLKLLLVTSGGLGLLKPAPGTWGSLPPVILALILNQMGAGRWTITITMLALCLLGSLVCLVFGGWSERCFEKKDPGQVVADEVAGQSIPLLFLPFTPNDLSHNLILAGLAFALFRGFDITKPPPCRQLQNIPGGRGILLDDLIAGLYALISIQIIIRVIVF